MILQTLDIKNNCKGIFCGGSFLFEEEKMRTAIEDCSVAWKHSTLLQDEKYRYLFLYLKKDDISEYSNNSELFKIYTNKIEAHRKAAISAKVSLEQECFFDLLPEHQLIKLFNLRHQAMQNIHKKLDKQEDYEILHKAHVLTTTIAQQDINYKENSGRVLYDIFGSATGRLTTKKCSVPVLNMKKEQRKLLKPQNDVFIELDLNAAEIRMLMALSGREQPQEDIHDWVVKNVFDNVVERSQAKVELFAWLYNPSSSKSRFDKIFSRQIFRDFYFFENQVLTTPFGRKLKVEERKAQNYLLQSTTSDQVLENAYKIQKMLDGKKSKVAFTLHDSIILDMAQEDATMIRDIKNQFEFTRWGKFKSTCKIGRNFGELKDLQL